MKKINHFHLFLVWYTAPIIKHCAYILVRTRITEPPQDSRVVKGSTVEMKCGVAHDAAVTVTWVWYHNDARIPPEDERRTVQDDGTIQIRSVRSEDIGNYRCMVHSVAGNDTQDADMQVIGNST